jgi:hypothetical protein
LGKFSPLGKKKKKKIGNFGNFHYFSINLTPKNAKFYNKFRY